MVLGASVDIFTEFYRIATGNLVVGILVNHSLYDWLISLSMIFSYIRSKLSSQLVAKWQFYSKTQWPTFWALMIQFLALSPYPCPSETIYRRCWGILSSLAKSMKLFIGSAPGLSMYIRGFIQVESLKAALMSVWLNSVMAFPTRLTI